MRLAECISGSALHSLQHIYRKRCKSRADKIIKVTNHPGNCLLILLTSGKRFRSLVAKTGRLRRSFFPQAIRLLNSHNINMTPFNNHLIISKIFIILYHSYCCYVNTLHNLFAHCSCAFLLILLFIKSTVYCPAHFILLQNVFDIVFFFYFIFFTEFFSIPIFM